MNKIVINGQNSLNGEVEISGAKNAAVAIIPAAILVKGVCVIENVPHIRDVDIIIEIMDKMGAKIEFIDASTLSVDCSNMHLASVPSDLARKMRASYYFLGSLLGRFHRAQVDLPGGCDFGVRPIDLHIKAFEALGAGVIVEHGIIYANAEELSGTTIYFDTVSVGATINAMLAASLACGVTHIENAAKEPHIVDVANFLNSMGANVKGAGTDTIKIRGVEELYGGSYAMIPDQIEAGTYMVAAAAAGGDVTIKNVIPKHLEAITSKILETGVEVIEYDESVRIISSGRFHHTNIKTMPYPGFPTDMQPQMSAFLATAIGTSIVNESVWDNRFKYVDELKRMGAHIKVEGKIAIIEGTPLTGAVVRSCDLRAGAAMIIAGLVAVGTTTIEDIEFIERGYEKIVDKLKSLGADITKITANGILPEDVIECEPSAQVY
ncbi:MAG: UDP-N-acetylglucosamine 1-carboxyvinyltransferase [Clostridia bacterium]